MTNYIIHQEPGHINLSPLLFRNTAQDFFKCYLDFEPPPGHFSPVPFFLCCRAIEMALKAIHLETENRDYVKKIGHNLIKSYKRLDVEHKNLSKDELDLLNKANKIYIDKDFEYLSVIHPVTGFTRFPDIEALGNLARKLTDFKQLLNSTK